MPNHTRGGNPIKIRSVSLALTIVVVGAIPAMAHVTVQPAEAIMGSFSRFVVRVPNEEQGAATTRITVQLPPLAFVSFQPKDGWQRSEKTVTPDEPIDAFGQEITETIGSVTWTGGSIGPGEFEEFGFSARMPDEETELSFRAIQVYDSGKTVRWTGAPDSEEPAALVHTYDIGVEEGGELAAIAALHDQVAAEGSEAPPATEVPDEASEDGDDGDDTLPVTLSGAALVVALGSAGLALRNRKS